MTDCPAWDSDALLAKATLYFSRAFEAERQEDAEIFAFWAHLALELLARAAVAKVNPALLAQGSRKDSLQYGLGLRPEIDPLDAISISTEAVVSICKQFVEGFGSGDAAVCTTARRRRNAELHSATAAMADLERGWRGRMFGTCKTLCLHLETDFAHLFGADSAEVADRLIAEDAESVRAGTREAIEGAKARLEELTEEEIEERTRNAEEELKEESYRRRGFPLGRSPFNREAPKPRVLAEVPCPVCKTTIALRGEVVQSSPPRIDEDGQLVQSDIALPTLLECPVCELRLDGISQLTQAGFGDPVYLRDYPDPIETFDVDIHNYRDEFLQSLAEDSAYEDE